MLQATPFLHRLTGRAQSVTSSVAAVGWLALIVAVVSDSTYNTFAKQLSTALSPVSLLLFSEGLTAFFVLLSFGTLPTLRKLPHIPRRAIPALLGIALCSSVVAPLLWFWGLESTTAVNASIFSGTDALFLLIIAILVLREPWNRMHIICAGIIFLGVLSVSLRGFQESFTFQRGDMLILIAAVAFSVGGVAFRDHVRHVEPQLIILVRSLTAIAAFFLLSPFMPQTFIAEIFAFPAMLIPALLGFAFIARFLNIFTFYEAIARLPVTTVSLWMSLKVIIGPLIATIAFRGAEPLSWYHFFGGGLILIGTVLLEVVGLHPSEKHLEQHLIQKLHHQP